MSRRPVVQAGDALPDGVPGWEDGPPDLHACVPSCLRRDLPGPRHPDYTHRTCPCSCHGGAR